MTSSALRSGWLSVCNWNGGNKYRLVAAIAYAPQLDDLVDATGGNEAHPLWGLIGVAGDRIREYEARVHPWPDTSTPATVLAGKRALNLRQVQALAQRFRVPMEMFAP